MSDKEYTDPIDAYISKIIRHRITHIVSCVLVVILVGWLITPNWEDRNASFIVSEYDKALSQKDSDLYSSYEMLNGIKSKLSGRELKNEKLKYIATKVNDIIPQIEESAIRIHRAEIKKIDLINSTREINSEIKKAQEELDKIFSIVGQVINVDGDDVYVSGISIGLQESDGFRLQKSSILIKGWKGVRPLSIIKLPGSDPDVMWPPVSGVTALYLGRGTGVNSLGGEVNLYKYQFISKEDAKVRKDKLEKLKFDLALKTKE